MDSAIKLTSLPEDILVLVFPYLEPKEFLALCSINREFHYNFYQNPEYWRERTASTFRVPIQPMLRADGTRWHWLYKNLRTRTQIYTWGKAHVLSGKYQDPNAMSLRKITWPTKMVDLDLGPVADLQCGGWSTTLLTSDGVLHAVGLLNTGHSRRVSLPKLRPLKFPEVEDCSHEATAIRQFSSGRSHILGLSDDGRIWSWDVIHDPGVSIQFTNVQISVGRPSLSRAGCVTKVIAGWNKSTAYIVGTGIVYWEPLSTDQDHDGSFVTCTTVPGTSFKRADASRDSGGQDFFGEVRNYVVLERYIVFVTDLNKVYAFKTNEASAKAGKESVVELTTFAGPNREIKDIHGSFRRFAILTLSGEVLMGNEGMIDTFWNANPREESEPPNPNKPHPLQHTNVVSIAFGDHHFHALHAHGKISSHGVESGGSGSFGLGSSQEGSLFRGVRYGNTRRPFQDNTLTSYAQENVRYIWFEPEKKQWLSDLNVKADDTRNGSTSWNSVIRPGSSEIPELYNQCIEREGEAWGDFSDLKQEEDYSLGAYFALTVAAGGWQSGALVLFNEDLAEKIRLKHTVLVEEKGNEKPKKVIGAPTVWIDDPRSGEPETATRTVRRYKWEMQHFPTLDTDDPRSLRPEMFNWFKDWKYGMPPA